MSHNANHCQLFSRINVSAQVHRNNLMLLELQQGGLQSSLHMLPHHREKIKKTKTNAASGQAHAWTAPALPPKASALAGREKALTVSPKVSASAPGEGGKTGFPPLKMMPRTTLCHSEIRATKAVKGYSQCSFQRRPRSLQQLITNTPAELEGAELRHKHFLICAFSKMENTPPDGKNVTTQEAAIWTGWQYHMTSYTSTTAQTKQHHRAELHLPFSLAPAGQALSVKYSPVLQEQTTAVTTLPKYRLQPQHAGHFAKKATLLSSKSHLINCFPGVISLIAFH